MLITNNGGAWWKRPREAVMTKAHNRRKPTVLVIDDAVAVSTTLMWVLRENGYDCAVVGSRTEALNICGGISPGREKRCSPTSSRHCVVFPRF